MRLPFLACFAVASFAALALGDAALAQRHAGSGFHPPTRCPELSMDGFCHYDTGWRPAADNPLFSPLRPGDPQAHGGPSCDVSDSRGRTLLSYETENPAPAMRIGGRLVRFRPAGAPGEDRFAAAEGRLRIDEGAVVARDHESQGNRARLTFTDRRGRAHAASVRIDCGL